MVTGVFFDTSVLVAGIIELGASSIYPKRIIDLLACGKIRSPHTAWHCCLEFLAVTTRLPDEYRLSSEQALSLLKTEILAHVQVHQLPKSEYHNFLKSIESNSIIGGRIYDIHIAEIARSIGMQVIITENRRHFTTLMKHQIRVFNAQEYVMEID